ncbi:MAG TPA: hypothetical protein VGK29_03150 [Paludibaculum sp.]|jgi:hypothetical protein
MPEQSRALRQVKDERGQRIGIDDILECLTPEVFDEIEAKLRRMREAFHCELIVSDFEGFKDVIFEYHNLYHKTFYNADLKSLPDQAFARNEAYEFALRNMTKYNPSLQRRHARDLHEQERNAITGRNGGMISVIDEFTDALVQLHITTRIELVFFDLIPPSDYDTRFRLADELLQKYGTILFRDKELVHHAIIAMNLQEFVTSFVMTLRDLRRSWQH